jgi:hypothetical protein
METLDIWRDLLRNKDVNFVGGTIETRDVSGDILRGPISKICIEKDALMITTKWTIRLPHGKDPDDSDQWQRDITTTFLHIGAYLHEPLKAEGGLVKFRSDFRDNILFPKNYRHTPRMRKP